MEIKAPKDANIRTLSWAIYKAVGLNLGGWNNLTGVSQLGHLSWSESDGLTVTIPDTTPLTMVAQIEVLVAAHDAAAPLPPDFPPEPIFVPPPDPTIAIAAAASDVVTEIDKAFTARSTKLSDAEKVNMRDRVVALIARAQER